MIKQLCMHRIMYFKAVTSEKIDYFQHYIYIV